MRLFFNMHREIVREETHSWTTTRFTWGEGSQEIDHRSTTTDYQTTIEIYVDDVNAYYDLGGLDNSITLQKDLYFNPELCAAEFTGIKIVRYQSPDFCRIQNKGITFPDGYYILISEDRAGNNSDFTYKRVYFVESSQGLTLVRTIIVESSETKEE